MSQENKDLGRLFDIYAETIRQLTIDNAALQAKVSSQSGDIVIATRRHRHPT